MMDLVFFRSFKTLGIETNRELYSCNLWISFLSEVYIIVSKKKNGLTANI